MRISDWSSDVCSSDLFDAKQWLSVKDVKRTDPFIHYGVAAAKQAVSDAGLEITDDNRERIGVCVGAGIGGIGQIAEECRALTERGPKRGSPFFGPRYIKNNTSGYIRSGGHLYGKG